MMETPATLSEPLLRFAVSAGVLVVMAALEVWIPKRRLTQPRGHRWLTNLSIIGTGLAIVKGLGLLAQTVAVPLVALAVAETAAANGIGLFNVLEAPAVLEIAAAVIVLDFAIWLQHVISHKVPLFWRLHQVHHADRDIDVTTALRFHPVEIGLSMLYKSLWVLVLGAAPLAVLAFEVLLNACAMFNHANVSLPPALDRSLRLLVVTPDMHRIHHSDIRAEHDSNYGFNLSIWDRLFNTYTGDPRHGHSGMTIGLAPYQDERPSWFWWCLSLPFARSRK